MSFIFACLDFILTHHICSLIVLQKACKENFGKFQEFCKSTFDGSEKDRYFLKILKWQHKLVRNYKLVSYFLSNATKTCLYGLNISEEIEIEHVFQSKAFLHLSGNLHTSCFRAFQLIMFEFSTVFGCWVII